MSRYPRKALALVFALLVPMALVSCSGWTPQAAGHRLVEGGFEYLDSPEGQAKVAAIAERGTTKIVEAGTAKLSEGLNALNAKMDPAHNGEWAVAIEGGALKLAQPLIDKGVDTGISALEAKHAALEAKIAAGTATPWDRIAEAAITAILAAATAYQKGHRTGETKGWADATGTGNGTAPKT